MAALTPTTLAQDLIFAALDTEGPCSDAKFKSNADVKEGVAGRLAIDATYENTDYELQWGEDCPKR